MNALNHGDPNAVAHEADEVSRAFSAARDAERGIQRLCRSTVSRSRMTPAEVDAILAHLAEAAVALSQAAWQLGDMLDQSQQDHVLDMDGLTKN